MASYEEAASTVLSDIESAGLSASTEAAIKALISESGDSVAISDYDGSSPVPENTQIVNVPAGTNLTSDPGAGEVIIMGAGSSANVTFGADSTVETLVLGDGSNTVAFEGDKNITIEMTGGNDSVSTGGGDDTLTIKGGDASVNTGEGDDVVTIQGDGRAQVTGGSGNMVIRLETTAASATIDAGDGFDRMDFGNPRAAHNFEFKNGKFFMHSDGEVALSNVEVVAFDQDGTPGIRPGDKITVLTTDFQDNIAAKLYKVVLGREAIDNDGRGGADDTLDGLLYWMHEFDTVSSDKTVEHMVRAFLECAEIKNKYDDVDDAGFVNTMFANVGIEDTAWASALIQEMAAGSKTRADVALELTASDAVNAILGVGPDGEKYVFFEDGNITE